jgi:hypothetical protein
MPDEQDFDHFHVLQNLSMRFLECHGRVVPMKQYSTGAKAHFEHVTAHKGCSTQENV